MLGRCIKGRASCTIRARLSNAVVSLKTNHFIRKFDREGHWIPFAFFHKINTTCIFFCHEPDKQAHLKSNSRPTMETHLKSTKNLHFSPSDFSSRKGEKHFSVETRPKAKYAPLFGQQELH